MTVTKGSRRRRRTSVSAIPRYIAEWFAGTRRFSFYAHTPPYSARVGEYWAAWLEEHPDAVKPKGLDLVLRSPVRPPPRQKLEND